MKMRFWGDLLLMCAASLMLVGCVSSGGQLGSLSAVPATGVAQKADELANQLAPANGVILGKGAIRVAMLVPKSAAGFGVLAAENFSNAAELALREFDENTINIVVKDTGGNEQGAIAAAQEAIAEGAEIILGPVFSKAVPAVASVARQAGVQMITFSNASAVGGRGVHIFGFTPEPGIARAIRYAGNQGNRSFAALLPNNAFGALAEAAFRQSVASSGGRIASITRYGNDPTERTTRAQEIGALVASGQVDAVFVPDAGDVAPQLIATIKTAATSNANVRFIGSGQWDDPRIFRNPDLAGAIYPAPDRSGFEQFAQRYNAAFGKPPIRLASLAYDAASLMVVLSQNFGEQRFSETRLTNSNGFKGVVDGTFRLTGRGEVQRALAVYEVTATGPQIVSPAPVTFSQTALSN